MNRHELFFADNGLPRAASTTPQQYLSPNRRPQGVLQQQQIAWERHQQTPTKRLNKEFSTGAITPSNKRTLNRKQSFRSTQMFLNECRKTKSAAPPLLNMSAAAAAPSTPRWSPTKSKSTAAFSKPFSIDDSAATPTTRTTSTSTMAHESSIMAQTPSSRTTRCSNNKSSSPRIRVSSRNSPSSPAFLQPAPTLSRRVSRRQITISKRAPSTEKEYYYEDPSASEEEDDSTTSSSSSEEEDDPTFSDFGDVGFEEPNFFDEPEEPDHTNNNDPSSSACDTVEQFFLFDTVMKKTDSFPTTITPKTTLGHKKPVPKQQPSTEMEQLELAVRRGRELAVKGYKTAAAAARTTTATAETSTRDAAAARQSRPQPPRRTRSKRSNNNVGGTNRRSLLHRSCSSRRCISTRGGGPKTEEQMHQIISPSLLKTTCTANTPPRSKSTVGEKKSNPRNKLTRTKSAVDWRSTAPPISRSAEENGVVWNNSAPVERPAEYESLMNSYGEQSFSDLITRQRTKKRNSDW